MLITKIEATKRNKDRYSVFLDEKFAFAIDEYVLKKYKLEEGKEITYELIHEIVFEENLEYLKQRALDLVSRRPRSEKEVKDKLKEKLYKRISKSTKKSVIPALSPNGAGPAKAIQNSKPSDLQKQLINSVLTFLKKYDYLDDKEFANWLVEQRLKQNKGPMYIRQDLFKKGVPKKIIKEALQNLDTSKPLKKAYEKAIKKYSKEKDKYKRKNKIYSYLARRGFTYDEINSTLDI